MDKLIETISPFPVEELPRVWLWLADAGSTLLNDQGPQNIDEFLDVWLEKKALTWGVWRDGELGGWIAYEPITPETGNAHCVFRKAFWGHRTTRPALIQVVEDLWSIGVQRIGMVVPLTHHAIQALIGTLGAVREADISRVYLRDGQVLTRKGEPMPMIQYGLYREAWDAKHTEDNSQHDSVAAGNSRVA